jgi:hypothetical protein
MNSDAKKHVRITFALPGVVFKGMVFQQGMWGGKNPSESKCRIIVHFTPPDLSETLQET